LYFGECNNKIRARRQHKYRHNLESECEMCKCVIEERERDKPQACVSFIAVAIVDADYAMTGIAEDMCGTAATDGGSGGRYGLGGRVASMLHERQNNNMNKITFKNKTKRRPG